MASQAADSTNLLGCLAGCLVGELRPRGRGDGRGTATGTRGTWKQQSTLVFTNHFTPLFSTLLCATETSTASGSKQGRPRGGTAAYLRARGATEGRARRREGGGGGGSGGDTAAWSCDLIAAGARSRELLSSLGARLSRAYRLLTTPGWPKESRSDEEHKAKRCF